MTKTRNLFAGVRNALALSLISIVLPVASADDSLIFNADFDQGTDATFAKGGKSAKSAVQAEFQTGVRGQALVIGGSPEDKQRIFNYSAEGNIDYNAGTVSFWIKPLDWEGYNPHFNILFRTNAGKNLFLIYKYFGGDDLKFLFGPTGKWTSVTTSVKNWKPGQWHHVACTWNQSEMRIYLDGRLEAANKIREPLKDFVPVEPVSIGPGGWGTEKYPSRGSSLMDELKIFNRAISQGEVEKIYMELASAAGVNNDRNYIAVGEKTPRLDGNVSAGEYAFAGTIFQNLKGILAERQSQYFLSYDRLNLYVGIRSALPAGKEYQARERDGKFDEDERVDLFLSPTEGSQKYFHFIFNPGGGIYDADGEDGKWNCDDLKIRNQIADGIWTFEATIPFASLGFSAPPDDKEWKINIGRTFKSPEEATCIAPVIGTIGFADWSNFFRLQFRSQAANLQIKKLIDVKNSAFDANISAQASDKSLVSGSVISNTGREYGMATTQFTLSDRGKATPFLQKRPDLPPEMSYQLEVNEEKGGGKLPLYRSSFKYDSTPPLTVFYVYTLLEKKQLFVSAKNRDSGKVKVSFLRADGTCAVEMIQDIPKETKFFDLLFDLDFSKLIPDNYLLKIEHVDTNGKITGNFQQDYQVPGKDSLALRPFIIEDGDKVPAPWTPLKSDEKTAGMWGRAYDFSNGFLFSSLKSQGKELLSAPARLCLDGKDLSPSTPPQLRKISGDEMKAVWEKESKLGSLKVKSRLTVHFDGYCEVSMTLLPADGKPIDVKSLSLDIPLRGEYATLVKDSFVNNIGGKSGAVGDYWCQNIVDIPMLWVGNEDIGFNWIADDLSGWNSRKNDKNVEIMRRGEEAILRLNMVDFPMKLEKERTIDFGFTLTPSRPLDPKLRKYRTDKEWNMWCQPWKYFNYPAPGLINMGMIDTDGNGHDEVFLYQSHNFISPFCPEWPYWEESWKDSSRPNGEFTGSADAGIYLRNVGCYTEACLKSGIYRNFHLNLMQELLRKSPVHPKAKSYYFDFSYASGCENTAHGCSYWTDISGVKRPRVLNKETREVTLAAYRMIKKSDPEAKISYHLGYWRDMPAQNFCDILVAGEGWEKQIAVDCSYYNVFTPESFRATYLPQNCGMRVVIINQLVRALELNRPDKRATYNVNDPESRRAMLHFMGYLVVHDVDGWWYGWQRAYPSMVETLWKTQDRIGWDENVTFHPYWKQDAVKLVSPKSNRIMASAYTRNGKMLLAVLNDTDQEQNIKLELDLKKLGMSASSQGHDVWQTNKNYVLSQTWEDIVPARGFRMILWEVKEPGSSGK
jgi:hypothetical protein